MCVWWCFHFVFAFGFLVLSRFTLVVVFDQEERNSTLFPLKIILEEKWVVVCRII